MNLDVAGAGLGDLATRRPIDFCIFSFLEKCFYTLERICSFPGEKGFGRARVQDGCLAMGWVPGPGMEASLSTSLSHISECGSEAISEVTGREK